MSLPKPEFWIVTPSYNQAQFIQQTIDSVLNQDGVTVRYQVMDGKSSDGTATVLKKNGSKFSWVSEKDNGQTDAINKGFKKLLTQSKKTASDDQNIFVAYINSDDYYLPNSFTKVAAAFVAEPKREWLVGDCVIVDDKGHEIQGFVRAYKKFLRSVFGTSILSVTNAIPQPAVFMRLSAFKRTGNFSEKLRYVMDYEYWLRLGKTSGQPIWLSRSLAAFRIHNQSKGGVNYDAQFAEEFTVAQQYVSNPLLLFLHQLHTLLIVSIYKLIK